VGGTCGTHGGGEVFTGFWLGGPLEGPRHRWEDNIKMDLGEMGRTGFGWLSIGSSGGPL
jgi:hypothetical protein